MLSIGKAAIFLGVSQTSLRRWDKSKIFSAYRTPGGHRRYKLSDLEQFYDPSTSSHINLFTKQHILCYARVSGHKQKEKGDLQRQAKKLQSEAVKLGDNQPLVITDVGSGLNPNRSGLKRMFKLIQSGTISKILISFQDRLTRFGFPFIQNYCQLFDVDICEIDHHTQKNVQESLVNDMIALIACFSGKLYGMRSIESRKKRSRLKYAQKYFNRLIEEESKQILQNILQNFSVSSSTNPLWCKV